MLETEVTKGLAAAAAITLGLVAAAHEAVLLARNARDFAGIPGLTVDSARRRSR